MSYDLTDYEPYDFASRRHIGPSPAETQAMLETVGAKDLDDLIAQTLPESIRQKTPLAPATALSEAELLTYMQDVSKMNRVVTSLIGQGYHDTFTPPAIQRNILENPAWYTAYTPYQPEISQGRLEALLNFQTMIIDLTGLEVANASLLDEATACAEAMTMAQRVSKSKAMAFFVDEACHPQNIDVMQTRAEPLGIELIIGNPDDLDADAVFGAVFQYPGTHGHVRDFTDLIAKLHDAKAVAVMAADPLALTLLKEPGAMGADVVVGNTQRFGVPLGNGGPHAAYMATRDAYKRNMPGRIIGVSIDSKGNRAYRLSLQTREQHIRREKATSNVCTAQALLAVMASMYGVFHGPQGLKAIAQRIHLKTSKLAAGLEKLGFAIDPDTFFDTITVEVGGLQSVVIKSALNEGINLRAVGTSKIGIALGEMTTDETLISVWRAFGLSADQYPSDTDYRLPVGMERTSEYMTHSIFHMNRSEAEMTRYMRRLADRDLALDRTMIPLGSCTMKLNSAAEMMPITWAGFSKIHPFAPKSQMAGYDLMIRDLSKKLCEVTGYDAISMQPNSGAQGEYAGLMTIRDYHKSNGDEHRNICLIPKSAHGTNPASAQMVGYKVVVVATAENGDIDIEDFRAKAELHSDNLAATMITYPSTHGVFEEGVREICQIAHDHGGQVYMDGANMNAMVGLAQPGEIGSDVSHLNLHKTFCIPHGGGGPGMGPIGVRSHLIPHLPGHSSQKVTVQYQRAIWLAQLVTDLLGVLPDDGIRGLTNATKYAILNANYIATRLKGAYDVLYKGPSGRVAHECIIDTRPLADDGVTVDDIAKRLVDCGFHAPTMSFPVAGTLMIEPTESEPKAELDRFCDAMLGIRQEAQDVADGKYPADNNPLSNAPHTMRDLVGDWDRPYTREQACFPAGSFKVDKYWAPVNRVDNAYGDKNLICSCPPMEDYLDAAE